MEELLKQKYNELLGDMLIGHPINQCLLNEIITLIHQLHFVSFSTDSKAVLKILERYA